MEQHTNTTAADAKQSELPQLRVMNSFTNKKVSRF